MIAHPRLDKSTVQQWQGIVDLLAEALQIPVALIMHLENDRLFVQIKNESINNPYQIDSSEKCSDSGLYCEAVTQTKERLFVLNALEDEKWKTNPDVKLNMVNYLGYPLMWPNGDVYGTICVLDTHTHHYSDIQNRIMLQFKKIIDASLEVLEQSEKLKFHSNILNKVAHGIHLVRASDALIVFANPQFEIMFGYESGELIGKHVSVLNGANVEDSLAVVAIITEALVNKGQWEGEVQNIRKDGTPFWCYATVSSFDHPEFGQVYISAHENITERKLAEVKLLEERGKLEAAFESSEVGFVICNAQGGDITMNATALSLHEYASVTELHRTIEENENKWELLYLDGRIMPFEEWPLVRAIHGDFVRDFEFNYHNLKTGAKWICSLTVSPVRNIAGEVTLIVQTLIDITDKKHNENIIEQYRAVIHASLDGFWITDTTGRIIEVNNSICQMHGYSRDEFLNMSISDIEADESPEDTGAHIREMLKTGHVQFEARHKRKNGTIANVEVSIMYLASLGNRIFAFIRDISHIKQHQAELKHLANFDVLTNIPNRLLLADRMSQAIAQTSRDRNMMGICYLDLDGFKPINDSLGHDVGDEVLVEVAKRIEQTIRGGDTVARLGGDEFAVLLLDLNQGEECVATLERLLVAIVQPITVKGKHVTVSASIGVSLYPLDDEDPDTLLRHADQAMYVAKQSGKNRFHIYDPSMDRRARDLNEFQKNIRHALEQNQFELFYQPKVNLRTKELIGAEALIRWRHPERGILSPAEFLSIIENTELDKKIGEWVIATALAQMKYWRSTGLDIAISINISGYHLESAGFVDKLKQHLARYPDMAQGKLQIEVLETVAINDITVVQGIIEYCRKVGVGFALDDFGTGYSSLSYLSHLQVDTLKIDQSFVRDMLEDKGDMAIVKGIIALAKAFKRHTVAEGIETERHFQALLDLGCQIGQGYGIARPMPADEIISWKKNYR
jgi:diguanylate cyclase (GGDEF)-like protein/PAS domain S-box-containing protein